MENFFWGLAALALAGMCGVAWKQPDFYNSYLIKWLIYAAVLISALGQVWDLSALFSLKRASRLMPELKGIDVTKMIENVQVPNEWWLGLVAFAAYGFALHLLASAVVSHGMKSER